jgi:N-acetylmuramic acid 6-phosphate etherase
MITEQRNPRSKNIDQLTTIEIVRLINEEDKTVAEAVSRSLPHIAEAIDRIAERLEGEGRLFYVGAGTSGRLGVLDAAECPPTFGVQPTLVQGVLAGGERAIGSAVEWVEDDAGQAARDLQELAVTERDAVVGLAASGKTPYTIGAVRLARRLGAFTVGISCNADTALSRAADVAIEALVGPEVVTGSTRMKAGTAQKMILNMISTGVMIRLGNVYGNLMVNLGLSNSKLVDRGVRIIAEAASVTLNKARRTLELAGDVRSAIVMLQLDCTADEARGLVSQSARINEILKEHRGTK